MDQNNNQEMYSHSIQPTQITQQIILPPLTTTIIQQIFHPPFPTTITCMPTTTAIPQEVIDLQQQPKKLDD
ncbi:hypothetical protein H5410_026840 [Solanum commersonii]|uniref:Uncharacterized protein n=1 Tax=Solanum commersonii TaxID=4109 RepID=A0A9J5Z1T2_SOLCO|nr:hypothetical protein H5410_026840 [Solanum commersonii]